MRERDRTLSIQKKKLLKTTTFSVVLLSVAIMVLSGAVSAISLNVNSTQMNINSGGQNQPLNSGVSSADVAGNGPSNEPTTSGEILEKQNDYQAQHRGVVVYDNTMGYVTLTSNQDDSVYGIDSEGADDFSFYTGGDEVCIQDVHWIGGAWNPGWIDDVPWDITFFEDDGTGNRPGDVYAGPFVVNPYKVPVGSYFEFSADIPEVCFPGCNEKFWIDIQAVGDYPPQYGWGAHNTPILGHELVWKAPYFGYPDWVDGATVFGTPRDYAFQLTQKADHDVSVIEINTGEFCTCLPIEVLVTNYGKFDEINVPVHVQMSETFAFYDEFWIDFSNYGYYYDGFYETWELGSWVYEFWAHAGTYYGDCLDTFDFSEACNPVVSFYMWHDNYGSDDYIRVTADGAGVGPQFFRSNGDDGWVEHQVAIPIGTTSIGFMGVADAIYDAYPIWIDNVAVIDLVYDETILVDIDVSEQVTVVFPDYCPCQWGELEDITLTFDITACTEMETDETPQNDCMTIGPISLYLPFFHDVAGIDIMVEEQDCLEFDVCVKIANLGQFEECCFKVYAEIFEFLQGPQTLLLYEEFYYLYPYAPPAGWTTTHPNNWRMYYTSLLPPSDYALRFYWSPSFVATSRCYTYAIPTAGMYELQIDFNHYLSHYGGPYELRIETSPDAVNWNTAKEWINPTGWTATAESITTPISSAMTYVSFTFEGDSFNLNYWYIDDLYVYGRTGAKGALEYSEWYCVDTIDVCEEQEFCLESWIPSPPYPECETKMYYACVKTALCDPMDENPINDEYCEYIYVDFWADIEVAITSPAKARNLAYASWVYPGYTMNSFDLATPGTTTVLGPYTGANFAAGGTWGDGDIWYVTDYGSAALMTADTTTGALTTIGGSGTAYNGIAYDFTTDTLYGASSYNLYEIDVGTGAQTLVGTWGTSYLMIDIAVDNAGVLYGHDIVTDSMYIIDKGTGAATLLGSTGQLCNYAQGMEFDHDNNILYAAAYTSSGSLYTVDTTTGLFTLVGAFASGAEVDGFAIPSAGGGGTSLPKADIWIPCGEQEICATITNNGVFDYVDDPSTPCEFEAVHVFWQLDWYYLTDPCEDPDIETVLTGEDTVELACGESVEFCIDYDYEETGIYQLIFWAEADPDCDLDNNIDTFNIGVDCCDPISEHTLTPVMPDGTNNWYKSDVTVKITAFDPLCPDPCYGTASGIKEIHYKINGVETTKSGDEVTFKIKDQGVNLVEYWAVDNAGNVEDKFTFEIAIDKVAPSCDLIFEKIEDGTVVIKFTAVVSDATSGIVKVEFFIGGTAETPKTAPPFVWEVPWQDSYKTTTFKAVAYDAAGNTAQDTVYGGDIPFAKVFSNAQSNPLSHTLVKLATQQI